MHWQTIDFQGIVGLESSLVYKLQLYLEDKEAQLAQRIANSIPQMIGATFQPALPAPTTCTKLSEGVELFARRVTQDVPPTPSIAPEPLWHKVGSYLNKFVWEYVEILEGIAVELFQQLDQVGFEQWNQSLVQVVEDIKDLLVHKMEDLKWSLKRLENQLEQFRSNTDQDETFLSGISRKLFSKNAILDKAITGNLEKSQKFLNFRFQNFMHRYSEVEEVIAQVEKIMDKFSDYPLLESLDSDEKNKFKQLYRTLKIWEKNGQSKVLPEFELIRSIHHAVVPEKAHQVFKEYYNVIKTQLFDASRNLKNEDENPFSIDRFELQRRLKHHQIELHTLGATIEKYREFLLKSDPDPYVRTRGGFPEWIIGLEPNQSKSLLYQEYDMETLDKCYSRFIESLGVSQQSRVNPEWIEKDIWETLHDMGQPLASKQMMEGDSSQFVQHVQKIDELASSDPAIVDKVTKYLSRALRADWKYNTLYELPLFHELYAIHQGILGPNTNRTHLARLGEFKLLTDRLEKWIKEKKYLKHSHEIEIDINDIKERLQDMLAYLQRAAKDEAVFNKETAAQILQDVTRQLMEYRYLFNHFFYQLRGVESDEKIMRNQFLFVDQYFESIENKLIEMNDTKEA